MATFTLAVAGKASRELLLPVSGWKEDACATLQIYEIEAVSTNSITITLTPSAGYTDYQMVVDGAIQTSPHTFTHNGTNVQLWVYLFNDGTTNDVSVEISVNNTTTVEAATDTAERTSQGATC